MATPVFVSRISPEQYEKESQEKTKIEMEKLAEKLKEKMQNKNISVQVYDTSDDEQLSDSNSDNSNSDSDNSNSEKDNRKQNKHRKSRKSKKRKDTSIVHHAVMAEKLKNEINTLESRLRYKELDMANFQIDFQKEKEISNKYNLIIEICNQLQEKECYLNSRKSKLREIYDEKNNNTKITLYKIFINEFTIWLQNQKDKLSYHSSDKLLPKITFLTTLIDEKYYKINNEQDELLKIANEHITNILYKNELNKFLIIFFILSSLTASLLFYVVYY
jgi:hypothetical protein